MSYLSLKESAEYLKIKKIPISYNYLRHLCFKKKIETFKKYNIYFLKRETVENFIENWDFWHKKLTIKAGRPKKCIQ